MFGNRSDQLLEPLHLARYLILFALAITVGYQPLNCAPGKIRHTPRTLLLADSQKLTELILRNSEIYKSFSRF